MRKVAFGQVPGIQPVANSRNPACRTARISLVRQMAPPGKSIPGILPSGVTGRAAVPCGRGFWLLLDELLAAAYVQALGQLCLVGAHVAAVNTVYAVVGRLARNVGRNRNAVNS